MKHRNILTLILLFVTFTVAAQEYSPCYTNNMAKGNTAFNQGRYSEARICFVNAKQCAGGNPTEAQRKINECDSKIKERQGILSIEPQSATAVYSESGHTLYAGIVNKVFFSAPNVSSKYDVQIPNCKVKLIGSGEMSVEVPPSLAGGTIAVTVMSSNKAVFSTVFLVKTLPDPVVSIANVRGGKCYKGDILLDPTIRATMDDGFIYDLAWTVDSFRVSLISKGMQEPSIVCQGNTLNEQARTSIQKASSNTVVFIKDVYVSCGDVRRELNGMDFIIR